MSNEETKTISPKILNKGPVNNEETILRDFWERSTKEEIINKGEEVNISSKSVELVKSAKDMVIIYSPKVTLPELTIELENAHNKGIRIYSLTTNLKIHEKTFKFGIMREKKDLFSTFMVIDPRKKSKGMWFHGELTSNSKPEIVVDLDRQQSDEAWAHFCYFFWRVDGQELFFQKIRKISDLSDKKPEVSPTLDRSTRHEGFERLYDSDINLMTLPLPLLDGFEYYRMAKELKIALGENARDIVSSIDTKWTQLSASEKTPVGYSMSMSGNKEKSIVFGWDIAFHLNDQQQKDISKNMPQFKWKYHKEKKIGEINGKLLLSKDNWDEKIHSEIKDNGIIELEDVQSESIDDWLIDKPKPEFPEQIHLLKKIEYRWRLIPPQLPGDSKKHRLYNQWDKFDKELKKYIDQSIGEIKKMNQVLSQKKELKKITIIINESQYKQWIKSLEEMSNEDWKHKRDTGDVKRALDQIKEIRDKFKEGITEITKDEKDDKKKESNELEEILSLSKKTSKSHLNIPHDTLPIEGTLYEHSNKTYFAIRDIKDIEKAKASAKRYKALLVAEGGD